MKKECNSHIYMNFPAHLIKTNRKGWILRTHNPSIKNLKIKENHKASKWKSMDPSLQMSMKHPNPPKKNNPVAKLKSFFFFFFGSRFW